MANEIEVRFSLQIKKDSIGNTYRAQPTVFRCDWAGVKGPTPGILTISVGHTVVDFSQLATMGGWIRLQNMDPTNTVSWGVYDQTNNKFIPVGDLKPGEFCGFRTSRYLNVEEVPGTGTTPTSGTVKFALKASVAPCNVLVEAFEA